MSQACTNRAGPAGEAVSLCTIPDPVAWTWTVPAVTVAETPVESVWTSSPSSTQVTISTPACGWSGNPRPDPTRWSSWQTSAPKPVFSGS